MAFVFVIICFFVICAILTREKDMENQWEEKLYENQKVNEMDMSINACLATLITKRIFVKGTQYATRTRHYITFEIEQNRIEFEVTGETYGLLVEGDIGELTYQGDKIIKFERRV